ncbi:MAG: alpha/beta hydrolase [Candidatus Eisenbacteria bacterium]
MPRISVGKENAGSIELHYEDHGAGKPVVLIHGWPLSGKSWEKQTIALVAAGYRVITYDRRGFGESSKPWSGYDYDTLASDLDHLLAKLDLREAALVGFSMGGGEVARLPAKFGTKRVSRLAFVSAVTPCLLQSADNPEGVDLAVFDSIRAGLAADRYAFLAGFLANFFNFDVLGGTRVSDELVRASWHVGVSSSPKAMYDCVAAWGTDFRADLAGIALPTLVVHGDADRIVPAEVSGRRTHVLVKGSRYVEIPGAPHGLNWTHAEELNKALLEFLAAPVESSALR